MSSLPMLLMTGRVDNIFLQPQRINEKTGETYGGQHKLQLRVDMPLENGDCRRDIVTLSTSFPEYFRAMIDEFVSLPVGVMASGGHVHFYVLKSWSPPSRPLASSSSA